MTRVEELAIICRSLRATERLKEARECSLTRQLERRAQTARAMDAAQHDKAVAVAKHNTGITRSQDEVPRRRKRGKDSRRERELLERIATSIEEDCAHESGVQANDAVESPLEYFERLAAESMGLA